jgi:hypothetical protein
MDQYIIETIQNNRTKTSISFEGPSNKIYPIRKSIDVFVERLQFVIEMKNKSSGSKMISLNRPVHYSVSKNGEVLFSTTDDRFKYIENRLHITKNSTESYRHLIHYLFDSLEFNNMIFKDRISTFSPNPILKLFGKTTVDIMINSKHYGNPVRLLKTEQSYSIVSGNEEIEYSIKTDSFIIKNEGRIQRDFSNTGENLKEFIVDPLKYIIESNISMGECCFCERPLSTKSSIMNGYGKICSEKYNLPYIQLSR